LAFSAEVAILSLSRSRAAADPSLSPRWCGWTFGQWEAREAGREKGRKGGRQRREEWWSFSKEGRKVRGREKEGNGRKQKRK
jgi:hypothetical protein